MNFYDYTHYTLLLDAPQLNSKQSSHQKIANFVNVLFEVSFIEQTNSHID
mgnify:CR=1 FL=1